jgi:hypothetical protein
MTNMTMTYPDRVTQKITLPKEWKNDLPEYLPQKKRVMIANLGTKSSYSKPKMNIPKLSLPNFTNILPSFTLPEIKIPKLSFPELVMPGFLMRKIDLNEIENKINSFTFPKPNLDLKKINPNLPAISFPKFNFNKFSQTRNFIKETINEEIEILSKYKFVLNIILITYILFLIVLTFMAFLDFKPL